MTGLGLRWLPTASHVFFNDSNQPCGSRVLSPAALLHGQDREPESPHLLGYKASMPPVLLPDTLRPACTVVTA